MKFIRNFEHWNAKDKLVCYFDISKLSYIEKLNFRNKLQDFNFKGGFLTFELYVVLTKNRYFHGFVSEPREIPKLELKEFENIDIYLNAIDLGLF
jgi:hypothetical protein